MERRMNPKCCGLGAEQQGKPSQWKNEESWRSRAEGKTSNKPEEPRIYPTCPRRERGTVLALDPWQQTPTVDGGDNTKEERRGKTGLSAIPLSRDPDGSVNIAVRCQALVAPAHKVYEGLNGPKVMYAIEIILTIDHRYSWISHRY